MLPTVLDGLLEHSVLVPEPVPHRRQLHRGHGVEKARGQTPEPAVAQPGVGFLLEQAEPIEGRLLDGLALELHRVPAGDLADVADAADVLVVQAVAVGRERVQVGFQILQVEREVENRRVARRLLPVLIVLLLCRTC